MYILVQIVDRMAKPIFQELSSLKWYPLTDRKANKMAIVY